MRTQYFFLLAIIPLLVLISCSKSIEPTIRYYEKNGEQWYEKKIYCYPDGGKYPSTKGKRKLAKVQQYKGNQLIESLVYYEFWPNWKVKHVSDTGFYTYKNGKSLLYNDSIEIPDNIIVTNIDSNNNVVTYYYKDGNKHLYTKGKPDGVKETIYSGDKPGVYVWKNGEKIFLRELTPNEIEESRKFEIELKEKR